MKRHFPLAKLTWFNVGGPAEYFAKPRSVDELKQTLSERPADLPIFTLGAGSNVLIRDGGYDGLVLKLAGEFNQLEIRDNTVIAGAGVLDRTLALTLAQENYSNLEFFVGIPGSIGGAIAMNAGAYDSEVKDHLLWVDLMTFNGEIIRMDRADFKMTYRKGNVPKDHIVLRAAFALKPSVNVQDTIEQILKRRDDSQPTKGKTGGSTFKNPLPLSAWKLIDEAGCRGHMIGGAQISPKHCNFLMNLGDAKASDIEELGEFARMRVLEKSGVDLHWEILRIGYKS